MMTFHSSAQTAKIAQDARRAIDATQKEMAKLFEVSQPTISHWEGGQTMPPRDQHRLLAQILDLDKPLLKMIQAAVLREQFEKARTLIKQGAK